MPPPPRRPPTRPPSSRQVPRQAKGGPVIPLLIIVVIVLAAGGAAWFLLGRKPAPTTRRPVAELVAAFEAGEDGALAALAERTLSEDSSGNALRERIAAALKPLLVRDSGKEVLALAMRTAVHHRCDGLALPVLELFRSWPALPEVVGGPEVPAALIALVNPGVPGQAAAATQVLDGLAALVDGANAGRDLATRVCTRLQPKALATTPGMGHLLASLHRALPDPGCVAALRALTGTVFTRPDLGQRLGDDAEKWKVFIAEDAAARTRLTEIAAWIETNGTADRIADGLAKLEEHGTFLAAAQATCDGWLADSAWPGQLGHPRAETEALVLRVRQAQTANRSARAGAAIGAPKR